MSEWQNDSLMKMSVWKMTGWVNVWLTTWQIDIIMTDEKMNSWKNDWLTKWLNDIIAIHQNEPLTKW